MIEIASAALNSKSCKQMYMDLLYRRYQRECIFKRHKEIEERIKLREAQVF